MKVLLVEDDRRIASTIRKGCGEQGIEVVVRHDAASGRREALLSAFDVLVVDVLLPDGNGVDLCRILRDRGVTTPILLCTARDAVEDRVRGLDAGADDYLVKPFAFQELLARLRALTRRSATFQPETMEMGGLWVDLRSRLVQRDGRDISLSGREWDLLEFFLRNRGAVLDRASISAYVWDDNHDPASNALEVLVRRLRMKIDEGFSHPLIHTHRGAGYRFGP
ncbi:MAG: response regulator transcription factor [Longimicrobiales bacterium]|nr:response regulator transcription factor [Longimicrobiales bacterium]